MICTSESYSPRLVFRPIRHERGVLLKKTLSPCGVVRGAPFFLDFACAASTACLLAPRARLQLSMVWYGMVISFGPILILRRHERASTPKEFQRARSVVRKFSKPPPRPPEIRGSTDDAEKRQREHFGPTKKRKTTNSRRPET